MKLGQVPHRWAHPLLALLVALPLLVGLAGAALIWRLSQGPMESDFLARLIESQANRADAPGRLRIARAAVAWNGLRGEAPISLQLAGVTVVDGGGARLAALPDAAVTVAVRPLLRGVLAPATIELRGPDLLLRRDGEGHLALDLGGLDAADTPPEAGAGSAIFADLMRPADDRATHTALRRIRVSGGRLRLRGLGDRELTLEELRLDLARLESGGFEGDGEAQLHAGEARVPVHVSGEARAGQGGFLRMDLPLLRPSELSRLAPEAAPLAFLDAALAIQVTGSFDAVATPTGFAVQMEAPEGGILRPLTGAALPFDRFAGMLRGNVDRLAVEEARLDIGDTSIGGDAELRRGDAGWTGETRLRLESLDAARLASLWPEGVAAAARAEVLPALPRGRLSGLRVAFDVEADGPLREFRLMGGSFAGQLDDALIDLGPGRQIAPRRLEIAAKLTRDRAVLEFARLSLVSPARDAALSRIAARGEARLADGLWRGGLELSLDRVRLGDLPVLWPERLSGNERPWITQNLTGGEVRDGRWRLEGEASSAFDRFDLTRVAGEATVEGATVHWLRPIPPLRGVSGRIQFGLEEIGLTLRSGRQDREGDQPGTLALAESSMRILLPRGRVPHAEITLNIAGPLTETVAVLRHPRLRLFERRPFPVQVVSGTQEGTVQLGFPLVADLATSQVRVRAETRIRNARLAKAVLERDLEDLELQLVTDTEQLRVSGTGALIGVPLRLAVEMDFRQGPPTQVVARETVSGRFDATKLEELGFGAGALLSGPVAMDVRTERRRNSTSAIQLRGDLRESVLAFSPLNWSKPRGQPGTAEAMLRLNGEALTGIDNIRIDAPGVALRGRAQARAGRVERVEVADSAFLGGRFNGEARAPSAQGGPWSIDLRGPVLDMRPVFDGPTRERPAEDDGGRSPPLLLDLRFDRVLMGEGRDVFALQARGRTDTSGVLREAVLRANTARGANAIAVEMTAQGQARRVRGTAEDGGALLRALGIVDTIDGGRMTLDAQYADSRPSTVLAGLAELEQFSVRNAVALGKLLQAMTLYGLVEAARGGDGLAFTRAVVPFALSQTEVRLEDARAFSASLGLTARGRITRERAVLDLEGTIVPAYFFNSLLGNLPIIGRLFSPEAGGGLFAATFRARGPAEEAEIMVNPLAALTPGFLRGLFGFAEGPRP